eukprot:CAMPEP_0118929090 /NCGR_PEP_ID=MMETSP1169-20130426/6191_1 /TAXON_ID=36882 /ORGANISM="Pyramimonas obovata, Strain CCMP722" /LENGTH=48 /DNA_ID= /DNA_START= /DNA_END= /DNA_ORIENTATION=
MGAATAAAQAIAPAVIAGGVTLGAKKTLDKNKKGDKNKPRKPPSKSAK